MNLDRLAFLDEYLQHWDNFARGCEDSQYINRHIQKFYAALVDALENKDPRAVPRAAFYFFVQVFFFLPEASELYQALYATGQGQLRAREVGKRGAFLDSSQVWTWWRAHSTEYPDYLLLQEWTRRRFAQQIVIPAYERLARNPVTPSPVILRQARDKFSRSVPSEARDQRREISDIGDNL